MTRKHTRGQNNGLEKQVEQRQIPTKYSVNSRGIKFACDVMSDDFGSEMWEFTIIICMSYKQAESLSKNYGKSQKVESEIRKYVEKAEKFSSE